MEFYFWLSCCRCSCSLPEHCFTASVGKTWHADSMGPQCLFFLSVGVHHFLPGPQSHAHCLSSFLTYQTISSYYKQLPPREESQGRAVPLACSYSRHVYCLWHPSFSRCAVFDTKFHIFSSLIMHRFGMVAFNQSSLHNFCLSEIPPNSLERVP